MTAHARNEANPHPVNRMTDMCKTLPCPERVCFNKRQRSITCVRDIIQGTEILLYDDMCYTWEERLTFGYRDVQL